jgi:hypothetical protein
MIIYILAIMISLEPCALNADFQHFIPRFNTISFFYGYPWKKGLGVKEGPKDKVTLQIILVFTFTCPKTFKCIWQTFTLAKCKCKKI